MFHHSTLLLVLVSFTVLTTALLIAAALSAEAFEEQRLWAAGNVLASLGFGLGAMTDWPDLLHGAASYGLMGLGLALVLKGLRRFCGQDLERRWIAAIAMVAFLLPAYFVLVRPSLGARLLVSGIYLGALNLACAWTILRGWKDSTRRAMWVSMLGFVVVGAAMALRSAYLLVNGFATSDNGTAVSLADITLFIIPLAQVTIAFGMVMMVAHRHAESLSRLTLIDGLTGALNRVGLERMGARVLLRARHHKRSVSVAMLDADHFKAVNDTFGHPAGDQVLRHLVRLLTDELRPGDLVARYGGEEFVLVFDGMDREMAVSVAERLRHLVESATLVVHGVSIAYQVSIGLSDSDRTGHDLQKLIRAADEAMYQAKKQGRNRVCVA